MNIIKKIKLLYKDAYDFSEFEGKKTHLGTCFALFALIGVTIAGVVGTLIFLPPLGIFAIIYIIYELNKKEA